MRARLEREYANGDQIITLGPVGDEPELVRHDGAVLLDPDVPSDHSLVQDEVSAGRSRAPGQLRLALQSQFYDRPDLAGIHRTGNGDDLGVLRSLKQGRNKTVLYLRDNRGSRLEADIAEIGRRDVVPVTVPPP